MLKGALVAQVTPWIGVGPELSRSELAGGFTGIEGVVRLGPSWHAFYPYVIGGLGLNRWDAGPDGERIDLTGVGVGGGLSWAADDGRWRVGLESRYQWTPRDVEGPIDYGFIFGGGTVRVSW
jgi:hypothetical protein